MTQPTTPEPAFVWLEGEAPTRTSFNRHGWYSRDGVRLDLLSPGSPGSPGAGGRDGDWLAHYSNNGATAEAAYDFEVDQGGTYALWFRGSVYQVRQWYRLDGAPPVEVELAADARERLNLLEPGRIDLRFLAWVRLGDVDLASGRHVLAIGLAHHSDRQPGEIHGGIDALVLAGRPWAPSGAVPPSTEPGPTPGPDDWFPFVPDDDPLSPASVTDMRRLLERPAGTRGAVQRVGDAFAFADGTRVRFWGVNATIPATPALMARQAQFLAKNGVNLVRLHPVEDALGVLERDPTTGARRLDPARLDRLDRWFATLKAHGIYVDWSPFYPHVVTGDDGYPPDLMAELPVQGDGRSSSGCVNFMPALQDAEWAWLRALLEHENPYTGLRYIDDPALAILEIHNEDSVFWHAPLNDLAAGTKAPRHTRALQGMWAAWLGGRYADDAALLAAWGAAGRGSRPGDSLSSDRMPIYGAWEMAADGPAMNKAEIQRMGDFIRFLAETQRDYFARRIRALRESGFRGVTVTTAWQAGGPAANAANLWADTAADAIDRHAYFGGGSGGHGIAPGEVENGSHLSEPGSGILGIGMQQIEDRPFVASEWNQNPPNEWRAEIAPLVAFYGLGLQGWDASIHFTAGAAVRFGGGWPTLRSYASETPLYMGQFPALALAVQRGDVAPGAVVAARRLGLDDVFRGVDPLTQPLTGAGFDPTDPSSTLATPLEALAMGRVVADVDARGVRPARADWDAFHDESARVVTSTTGELAWHHGDGYVVVDAPRTVAVIGYTATGRTVATRACRFDVSTPFVSLILTSLDDRPLASTAHILVTALARDRETGSAYNDDGTELVELGGPPLLLEPVRAVLDCGGLPPIASVRPLDIFGVPRDVEVTRTGNRIAIDGRYATYLYEIRLQSGTATPEVTPGPGTPATASATAGAPDTTPTPTSADRTLTPPPTGATPTSTDGTPTPTPTDGTSTSTPTDGTPAPTPTDGTPTPTPTDGTSTSTPTDGTPTSSPTNGTPATLPPTATPGPPTPVFLPVVVRRHPLTDRFPQGALAEHTWRAIERLLEVHPLAASFPGYTSTNGEAAVDASAAAARANIASACADFPDLPAVFGPGVHQRACDGWVATYLGDYHAAAALRGLPGDHDQWAAHYFDIALDVAEDFAYGPEDRPAAGYRDTLAGVWQNPLRAGDLVVAAETLRQIGQLDAARADRLTEVTSAIARSWFAAWWETGIHPSHAATLTTRRSPDAEARSLAGRDVAPRVSWTFTWDADASNSPAEEAAGQGAAAMLVARALGDRLPDGPALAAAGSHYVDFALAYDRPDPIHGGAIRTLNARTDGGAYGQRRYWLKNHGADAPSIPYVAATWHQIGLGLMASDRGAQRPWPGLVPDDAQWRTMVAAADESLFAADGSFLVDLSPGGGVGYALERFPAWWSECATSEPGRMYTRYDGRGGGESLFVSEVGLPAGLDIVATGWPLLRLAAWRGDREALARWSGHVAATLDAFIVRPPDPAWSACKFAPYVSANPRYALARSLATFAVTYLGAAGLSVTPLP